MCVLSFVDWTMVNFVKPQLLGTSKEFANRFVNPIKNGQHSNSTSRDVQIMKKRAHILFKTLDGCVQVDLIFYVFLSITETSRA